MPGIILVQRSSYWTCTRTATTVAGTAAVLPVPGTRYLVYEYNDTGIRQDT